MLHNDSGKFECIFTAVTIQASKAIMLQGLEGSTLGIWAAHGEGKFSFPQAEKTIKYQQSTYIQIIPLILMGLIITQRC